MKEFILFWFFCVSYGFAIKRSVVKTLHVQNGGIWGTWGDAEFCPPGEYAIGYKMKIEKKQGTLLWQDDSSLNAIQLTCSGGGRTITSERGPWGDWSPSTTFCSDNKSFVAFALQVERPQGRGLSFDDTAANFVKFQCRQLDGGSTEVKAQAPGRGYWGDYAGWSLSCDSGTAICGLKTRIESTQGNGDDSALNDVQFYCCDD